MESGRGRGWTVKMFEEPAGWERLCSRWDRLGLGNLVMNWYDGHMALIWAWFAAF